MALYVIPVARRAPHQTQTTTLDGRAFVIRLDWNARIQRWFLSIETSGGTSIMRSRAVVLGADLLRQVRHDPAAPQGALMLIDSQGDDVEAGLDTLGARHRLIYFSD